MVRIDLLPQDLRSELKRPFRIELRSPEFILAAAIIIMGILWLLLVAGIGIKRVKLRHIIENAEKKELLVKEVQELKSQREDLKVKLELLKRCLKRDLIWSEKLTQLRELIPAQVWLNKMYLESRQEEGVFKDYLVMQGGVIALEEEPLISGLNRFVSHLKGKFFQDFQDLRLSNVKTTAKGGKEFMTFEVRLALKEVRQQ